MFGKKWIDGKQPNMNVNWSLKGEKIFKALQKVQVSQVCKPLFETQ